MGVRQSLGRSECIISLNTKEVVMVQQLKIACSYEIVLYQVCIDVVWFVIYTRPIFVIFFLVFWSPLFCAPSHRLSRILGSFFKKLFIGRSTMANVLHTAKTMKILSRLLLTPLRSYCISWQQRQRDKRSTGLLKNCEKCDKKSSKPTQDALSSKNCNQPWHRLHSPLSSF